MNRRMLLQAMALAVGGMFWPFTAAFAKGLARISDIRFASSPEYTRIIFQLDRVVKHSLFQLKNPDRLVVDIEESEMRSKVVPPPADSWVRAVRVGKPKDGVVRVVLELNQQVRLRSSLQKDATGGGAQLVVELHGKDGGEPVASGPPKTGDGHPTESTSQAGDGHRQKKMVIVLDPGHGGADPGAIGGQGTREKDIVMAVARKLAAKLNKTPGYQVFMTRTGDYYVPLGERVAFARRHNADLFISIHADAYRERTARGASVYCLSEKGKMPMDKALKALVERENNSDLIGGVNLGGVRDKEVAGILFDLTQRETINRGLALGSQLLSAIKGVTNVKFEKVMQAGFVVLKAPDVPSVLVELAFLTNPEEEAKLRQDAYQNLLVQALAAGATNFSTVSNRTFHPAARHGVTSHRHPGPTRLAMR